MPSAFDFNFNPALAGQGLPVAGNIADRLTNWISGDLDYRRQREMSMFNAHEAERAFNRELSASNTAYQRAAADMRAAGLNPYTMHTGGATVPSGRSASAAGGERSGAGFGQLIMSLVGSAFDLSKMALSNNNRLAVEMLRGGHALQREEVRATNAFNLAKLRPYPVKYVYRNGESNVYYRRFDK